MHTDGSHAIDVLMYHSISADPGPTSIPLATFRMHMESLAERGFATPSLAEVAAWRRGERELPKKAVAVTFDDGFADFAESAHPVLREHGFTATVFLPTDCIGGAESWPGAHPRPRPLMSWGEVRALADEGVDFGGHSLTHADLARAAGDEMRRQVRDCKDAIEQRIGRPVTSFAPPYGRATPAVREEIARHYEIAVGVRLGRATRACDPFDLPRIEMFYYQEPARWRAHLDGRGDGYLKTRQVLRGARSLLTGA